MLRNALVAIAHGLLCGACDNFEIQVEVLYSSEYVVEFNGQLMRLPNPFFGPGMNCRGKVGLRYATTLPVRAPFHHIAHAHVDLETVGGCVRPRDRELHRELRRRPFRAR